MLLKYIKITTALLIVFCMSCNTEKPVWASSYTLEKGYWSWDEEVTFNFDTKDTTSFYDLILEIETMNDYPFQNLYTKVATIFPKGDTIEQILSFDIYNKFGVQNGNCSKDKCDVQFIMQENFRFKDAGDYIFKVNQNLRQDSIEGINRLTLKLFEIKKTK